MACVQFLVFPFLNNLIRKDICSVFPSLNNLIRKDICFISLSNFLPKAVGFLSRHCSVYDIALNSAVPLC